MHLPCWFILWNLLCKNNLLFMPWFHFSQVNVVVAVLSTGAPAGAAGDPLRPASPAFFNWDLSYNTTPTIVRSLFLSVILCFPWTIPCMFTGKWGLILFTTLLWCKGVDLWWWRMCEFLFLVICVLLEWSPEQIWCYLSLFTLAWHALIGLVH
jgi:hypothetical protein